MKRILALVVLVIAVSACATTTSPGTPVSPGTTFKNCSTQAVETTAQAILGQVASALATGNYVAALATLAVQYGQAEVICAVQLVVNELEQKAAADALAATELANGQAYLKQQGAQ